MTSIVDHQKKRILPEPAQSVEVGESCCSKGDCQPVTTDGHHETGEAKSAWRQYYPALISAAMLLLGLAFDQFIKPSFWNELVRLAWYGFAFLPVGVPVLKEAIWGAAKGQVFTEFMLMGVATIAAFFIGEYPEGVAVMVFYAFGELLQNAAVRRAKGSIRSLVDDQPQTATILRDGKTITVETEAVMVGEIIQVKPGERVPLDGEMLSELSGFNTSALTGESKPRLIHRGESVLAGMINLDRLMEMKVLKRFSDSSLARIFELVQSASSRKSKTELLISKFANIYTPVVFFLAIALVIVPYFFSDPYIFREWLYRALVFLVISCPCALVISIPLGYFGGIGAASKQGILFKGSNYLDLITKLNTVVMDKTGTLTEGVFKVRKIVSERMEEKEFVRNLASLESASIHPIAKAVIAYAGEKNITLLPPQEVEEIAGHGLKGFVNGKEVLAGNARLLRKHHVKFNDALNEITESLVLLAVDNKYVGYVVVADKLKADAKTAVRELHALGVNRVVMLSGDKAAIVSRVAQALEIDEAHGDLLPEDKVELLDKIKASHGNTVAFVGDGINDAPALALSDIGIAMGGLGSDAAIETADVVIQTDEPSKIPMAIKIGRATKRIVSQNIGLAFAVKLLVLILGAGGLATMWQAVFADVGVALLAILNAVRIQQMKF